MLLQLKLILGLAHKIVEANGVGHIPAVQGVLGELAANYAGLEAIIMGQIENTEEIVPGFINGLKQ